MKIISVLVVLVVVAATIVSSEPPCKFYCEIPNRFGQYECCDWKMRRCPPSICPENIKKTILPNVCRSNRECDLPAELCCYDNCLEYKTCKPAYLG